MMPAAGWLGRSVERREDAALLMGRMPRRSAAARHRVLIELDGRPVEVEAGPCLLLSDFLRHTLGMTGTHGGCTGICGPCAVQIDGVDATEQLRKAPHV